MLESIFLGYVSLLESCGSVGHLLLSMVELPGADPKLSQLLVWGKSSHRKKCLWAKNRQTH